MTKQITFLNLVLVICLTSCEQKKTQNKNKEQYQNIYTIDTSVIAILPFDTTEYSESNDSKPADLTNDDLQKIDTILYKFISNYNQDQERGFQKTNEKHPDQRIDKKHFIIDLARYKRQYAATFNSKGEKEVWVNCICNSRNRNWKTELILVKDGGNCYFSLKINITTGQSYGFMVNGDA